MNSKNINALKQNKTSTTFSTQNPMQNMQPKTKEKFKLIESSCNTTQNLHKNIKNLQQ
jgi:hypothetical protein